MKNKYRVVTRWKTRTNVHRSDLAAALNKLSLSGWEVADVMQSYGRFVIVAKRRVREKVK